ncbi:helix-turn-helix transcriptional regulator [Arundinibacter roseus]|uniref:XRE family transcriptional regulator n=1 Tax=Arundinibacter roseus TaxID=2070510 RepID=A0A4R4KGS6_9BACT|nr:helix-turn-helix transcriptional regulator [Arundinibacter roseus]TDB66953.1 XRE family transcriptional regulator [Arundinibacter roseus]
MDLNDKIKHILVDKNISPSHFADEIGVQRSSISHILAGRNKPSLDIVQKIIRRYPDLGMDWIWEDEEMPPVEKERKRYESRTYTEKIPAQPAAAIASDLHRKKNMSHSPEQPILNGTNQEQGDPKTIEKILIFYSDGTFKQYNPV